MAVEQDDTKTENQEQKTDSQQKEAVHVEDNNNPANEAVADVSAAQEMTGAPPASMDEIDVESLKQEIESLRQQLDENSDRMLRNQAEMENLRKRTLRDVEHAHKYALDRFVRELLPVLDSLELGINASDNTEGSIESFREGMDLTLKKFLDTLEKFGVTAIMPQGDKFNPEKHEAVSMQELAGAESGTVVTVMQKGYELNGRLVRPAMVIVAR